MTKVELDVETMKQIRRLQKDVEKQMGYPYSVEAIINMALTALEDCRNGL